MAFPKIVEGPPNRPDIHHDHGFLDDGRGNLDPSKYRPPTFLDRAHYARWKVEYLGGAQAVDTFYPYLVDAAAAYGHFLDGTGTDFHVHYDRFLRNDNSGKTVLKSAVEDIVAGAIAIDDQKIKDSPPATPRQDSFSLVSDAITVGGRDKRYPYPATENWQKAIGAHSIWLTAPITVKVDPAAKTRTFTVDLTIHMEDMYNFNPGMHDIASGIPDSDNGRFEITRLAKEFLSVGAESRTVVFTEPLTPVPDTRVTPPDQKVTAGRAEMRTSRR